MTVGGAGEQLRARRREALLADAIDAVRRDGPFLSMEDLARACGVTKPILYRHFGDREGLTGAIARHFVDELVDALAPSVRRGGPPEDVLAGTIDAYLSLIERETNLYRFASTQSGADRRDLLASLIAESVALVIADALEVGERLDDTARPWAYALVGMVHFAGDWWVDQRDGGIGRAELVDRLMTLCWAGLGSFAPMALFAGTPSSIHPPAHPTQAPPEEQP